MSKFIEVTGMISNTKVTLNTHYIKGVVPNDDFDASKGCVISMTYLKEDVEVKDSYEFVRDSLWKL